MIRKWLIKHWWVNEIGKSIIGLLFAYIAYSSYQVSTEFSQPLVAFASGLLAMVALMFFVDTATVLWKKARGKEIYK